MEELEDLPFGDDLAPATRQELHQGKLPGSQLHVDVLSPHPVGAETRSPQATWTWADSWINSPIRSSPGDPDPGWWNGQGVAARGGGWPGERCGRCWL